MGSVQKGDFDVKAVVWEALTGSLGLDQGPSSEEGDCGWCWFGARAA